MSLIGIDLGTSAIKVVAYATNGTMLAQAARAVPGYRPEPGHWEVNVFEFAGCVQGRPGGGDCRHARQERPAGRHLVQLVRP